MTQLLHGLTRLDRLVAECLDHRALNGAPLPNIFGRLLPENPITGNLPTGHIVDACEALVDDMRTDQLQDGPADAGMTFFGQFVDHDITLDAQSVIGTRIDPRTIRNMRTPNLDLDCVYGNGPDASPHLYSEKHKGYLLFGNEGNPLDLPRNGRGTALIGDPRNDENVIVSQIQGAFICLHNILMTRVENGGAGADEVHDCAAMGMRSAAFELVPGHLRGFEDVRRFVRMHYQWLVLNDLLPAFVTQAALDQTANADPFPLAPIMPVEFSGAAYRFGHATVQPTLKMTAAGADVALFDMAGFGPRSADSDCEMAQLFATGGAESQKALPVGPNMAASLFSLPFVADPMQVGGVDVSVAQSRKLGLRNILRDRYALHIASGQQVARHLGIEELQAPQILRDRHITKTPLWFYCLQEAELHGEGRLTGVGGCIVASVFRRLLHLDDESVVHVHGFEPWSGLGGANCTMGSVMAFVEAHRDDVAHAADLTSGENFPA